MPDQVVTLRDGVGDRYGVVHCVHKKVVWIWRFYLQISLESFF